MAFISVTRLRLRARRHTPLFLWHAFQSVRQARRASGFLGGWLGGDDERGAWTATLWSDGEAMRAYRNAAAHLNAMPRLLGWCDEASFAHWTTEAADAPSGAAAHEQMRALGQTSKVRRPTARHAAGETTGGAAPRVSLHLRPLR